MRAPGLALLARLHLSSSVLCNTATVSWYAAAPDSEGIVPSYKVSVTINGNTTIYYTASTSLTFSVTQGQTFTVTIVPALKFAAIRELVSYLTGTEVQEKMARQLSTTPVDKAALASSEIQNNPALIASMQQIAHGRPMPIRPQMRQIWEGMRGPYQLVMNGAISAKEAAYRMQREAEKNIDDSNL